MGSLHIETSKTISVVPFRIEKYECAPNAVLQTELPMHFAKSKLRLSVSPLLTIALLLATLPLAFRPRYADVVPVPTESVVGESFPATI